MSYNPNQGPSDPPRVNGQQFGGDHGTPSSGYDGYGVSDQYSSGRYASHEYGSGHYGSRPHASDPNGRVRYGDGGYTDYGEYLDAVGGSGQQPYSPAQPGANLIVPTVGYQQQIGGYSQPMTYGAPGPMFVISPKVNALSGWAMWMGIIGLGGGFVCGLLSLIPIIQYLAGLIWMFLWLTPILAVIFGHVALAQIKRTGDAGRGQAIAGLVMGYIGIAFALIFIVFIILGILGIALLAGLAA